MTTDSNFAENKPEKRKVRVKTRIVGGKLDNPQRISRGRIAAILLLAAVAGVLLGLALGRGIRRAITVHRQQEEIAQSREEAAPGLPDQPSDNSASESVPGPGR